MNFTKIIIASTCFFIAFASFAQDASLDNFKPLEAQGKLPIDFNQRTSDKVDEAIDHHVHSHDDIKTTRTKENFLLRANYMIDNLLESGNVLFGDPVTKYTNQVADKILANEPELRQELRFYCLKSNATNAFATNQGMIFITTGLLAQLENEAQLAFILSHEIHHYKEKHVINSALENEKIISSSKRNRTSQDQTIVQLSSFSKSLELESDSVGYYYLQAAGYDVEEALKSFNILQFSELPYDELVFDFTEYDTDAFVIPEEIKLDTLVAINFEVDEDDSKSSHPNLNLRREKIENFIEGSEILNTDVKYIISEEDFVKIRDLCRFESIRIDLKNLDFVKAYYHTKYLSVKYPENKYLQKNEAKALYGLAKMKNSRNYFNVASKYSKYEGALSGVYYFFEKAPNELIISLAIKRIFEIKKNQPDEYLQIILNNLIVDFVDDNKKEEFDFDLYFPLKLIQEDAHVEIESIADSTTIASEPPANESKYEKLKRLKEEQEKKTKSPERIKTDDNYYQFVFTNFEYRDEVKALFDQVVKDIQDEIDAKALARENFSQLNSKDKKLANKEEQRKRKENYKYAKNIGVEKVVFVDPSYYTIDERKGVKLENSEDLKYALYDQITDIGQRTELETKILSPKLCTEDDGDKINHLSVCNDWIEEMLNLEEIDEELNFIPSQAEYMKKVSQDYGTENFAFSGVIDFKKKKKVNSTVLLSAVIPYGWPLFVAWLAKPQHEVTYYTYIFDANTGELKADLVYHMNRKAMKANINSYMYENFVTIKSAK